MTGDLAGRVTAALLAEPWTDSPQSAHGEHRFYAGCAVCCGDVDRLAPWIVRLMEPEVMAAEVDRFHAEGDLRDQIEQALGNRLREQMDLSKPGAQYRTEARAADLADAMLPIVRIALAEQTQRAEQVRDICARMRSHHDARKWADRIETALDRPEEASGR